MKYTTINALCEGIAESIRTKEGSTDKINPQDFPSRIENLSGSNSTIEYLDLRGIDNNDSMFQLLIMFAKAVKCDDGSNVNVLSGPLSFMGLVESNPGLVKAIEIDLSERTVLTNFGFGGPLFSMDAPLIDVIISLSAGMGMSINNAQIDAIPRIIKEEFYSNESLPKKYKIGIVSKKDISQLTYNAVDLGLPSGTLWADKNVGATSPEDPGTAFCWGGTEGYNIEVVSLTPEELCSLFNSLMIEKLDFELTPENLDEYIATQFEMTPEELIDINYDLYGVLGVSIPDSSVSNDADYFTWSNYFDTTDGGNTFNKYNIDGGFTVLQPEDDAATVNMGSNWRMPTVAEIEELMQYCDYETDSWDTIPYKFTSKINGNSITIPASIVVHDGGGSVESSYDRVWSSELETDSNYNKYNGPNKYAKTCLIYNSSAGGYNERRYIGLSVRGVQVK